MIHSLSDSESLFLAQSSTSFNEPHTPIMADEQEDITTIDDPNEEEVSDHSDIIVARSLAGAPTTTAGGTPYGDAVNQQNAFDAAAAAAGVVTRGIIPTPHTLAYIE
jgi:hypothetical protein